MGSRRVPISLQRSYNDQRDYDIRDVERDRNRLEREAVQTLFGRLGRERRVENQRAPVGPLEQAVWMVIPVDGRSSSTDLTQGGYTHV